MTFIELHGRKMVHVVDPENLGNNFVVVVSVWSLFSYGMILI